MHQLDLFTIAQDTREARHAAAVRAVDALAQQADRAMRAAGLWGYSGSWDAGLVSNPEPMEWHAAGVDPIGHARKWPATWHICGHAPDALRIELRPRTGQRDAPVTLQALETLRAAAQAPVDLEDEQRPAPYHCHGMWTWE